MNATMYGWEMVCPYPIGRGVSSYASCCSDFGTNIPRVTLRIAVAPGETLQVTMAGRGDPIILIPGLFGLAYGYRKVTPLLVDAGFCNQGGAERLVVTSAAGFVVPNLP